MERRSIRGKRGGRGYLWLHIYLCMCKHINIKYYPKTQP